MIAKKTAAATFALILLLVSGLAVFWPFKKFKTIEVDGHRFKAETVSIPQDREKGLGRRKGLPENRAMLFEFDKPGNYVFWMKDMRFDLDIIWISDGKIVRIAKNISHEALNPTDPQAASDKVLEINAGLSDQYGFDIGDKVTIF